MHVSSTQQARIKEWLACNRGVFSRIARSVNPPVTPQFVRLVAYGWTVTYDSPEHRVVTELKAAGWPGLKK